MHGNNHGDNSKDAAGTRSGGIVGNLNFKFDINGRFIGDLYINNCASSGDISGCVAGGFIAYAECYCNLLIANS